MQTITLRSRIGEDGTLHLDIPTNLSNTELEVVIWLRPVEAALDAQPERFSQWWAKQLAALPPVSEKDITDARFAYLAERYDL
jgi:hypothetical protein